MFRSLLIFAIALICHHHISANTDDLVSEVFGAPPAGEVAYASCVLNSTQGECVPFYLCSNESKILTGGEGVIDIRFSEDMDCKDYLTTCCFNEDILAEPRKPEPVLNAGCGVR